jgi:hypothetical protein
MRAAAAAVDRGGVLRVHGVGVWEVNLAVGGPAVADPEGVSRSTPAAEAGRRRRRSARSGSVGRRRVLWPCRGLRGDPFEEVQAEARI